MVLTSAHRAQELVNSFAVNTHLTTNTAGQYGNMARIKEIIQELKIKNIRDGGSNLGGVMSQVYPLGVKLCLISSGNSGERSYVTKIADYIRDIGIEKVAFVENPNEPDGFGLVYKGVPYPESVKLYATDLYNAIKSQPDLAHIPVVSTSVAYYNAGRVGDLSAIVNYGNTHPYPSDQKPEEATQFGNLKYSIDAAKKAAGADKPVLATETGYYECVDYTGTDAGQKFWITQAINEKYGVRRWLYHFLKGIPLTYFYELIDKGTTFTNKENTFGLYKRDNSVSPSNYIEKPLATHFKNLLSLLNDSATDALTFVTDDIDFTFSGDLSGLQTLLLQKSNQTFYLIAWRSLKSWDMTTHTPIDNPTTPLTISNATFNMDVKAYKAFQTPMLRQSFTNVSSFTFSVGDNVTVFEIKPTSIT